MKAPLNLLIAAMVVLGLLQWLNHSNAERIHANTEAQAQALIDRIGAQLNLHQAQWQAIDWVDLPGQPEALGLRSPRAIQRLTSEPILLIPSTSRQGYAGDIELWVAVNPMGDVLAVDLIQHRETPGIGDQIQPQRTDWLQQLSGTITPLAHRPQGQIDRLSGATITTQAVLNAVNQAVVWSVKHPEVFEQEVSTP